MSTRSGKRIHSSLHENVIGVEAPKSEVKTRTRCHKEIEEVAVEKKRKHYVRYPSEEDIIDNVNNNKEGRTTRKSRRNTLKERNNLLSDSEILPELKKPVRQTRPTKLTEDSENNGTVGEGHNKKKKTTKKKKVSKSSIVENQSDPTVGPKKKSNKKKSKRKSDSNNVENQLELTEKNNMNKSNMSIDSFYSAAGSPAKDYVNKPERVVSDVILDIPNSFNDIPAFNDEYSSIELKSSYGDSSVKKRKLTSSLLNIDSHNETDLVVNNSLHNHSIGKESSANQIFDTTLTQLNDETITTVDNNNSLNNSIIMTKNSVSELLATTNTESQNHTATEIAVYNSSQRNSSRKKRKSPIELFNNESPKQSYPIASENFSPLKNSSRKCRKSTREPFNTEGHDPVVAEVSRSNSFNRNRKKSATDIDMKAIELSNIYVLDDNSQKNSSAEKDLSTIEPLNKSNTASPKKVGGNTKNESITLNSIKTVTEDIPMNTTFEKPSQDSFDNDSAQKNTSNKKYSLRSSIVDKIDILSKDSNALHILNDAEANQSASQKSLNITEQKLNDTYDKKEAKTEINTTFDKKNKLDTTFEKQVKDTTYDKLPIDNGSIISSDSSNNLTFDKSSSDRISLSSDDSKTENIVNTTTVLIESSMDESKIETTNLVSPKTPTTPLKREGTFTKDGPEVPPSPKPKLSVERTPTRKKSLPSPGRTPFLSKSTSKEKPLLNLTHSIEKSRRSSLADIAQRSTKVMFCSPVNNPAVVTQLKGKVIKSNLKGSNKSFVFEDNVPASPAVQPSRKRSFTHSEADDVNAKRKRMAGDIQKSVDRLSRPRTTSATAKLQVPGTPTKKASPKQEPKVSRTRLPNFAALHQKHFSKMESLSDCQQRRARRARHLLTPTGALSVLERDSPKETIPQPEPAKKTETPVKPKQHETNAGYTRFGFKLQLDGNPFKFSAKNTDIKPKESRPYPLKRQATLPSLTGATLSRRDAAKQAIMREKSFTDRDAKRKETRTVIKGVRTNRRFELQMRMRNIV